MRVNTEEGPKGSRVEGTKGLRYPLKSDTQKTQVVRRFYLSNITYIFHLGISDKYLLTNSVYTFVLNVNTNLDATYKKYILKSLLKWYLERVRCY